MTVSIDAIRQALAELDAATKHRDMGGVTPAGFDRRDGLVRECEKAVIAAARASLSEPPANPWQELFWSVAKELNCLPSTFVDANDHVIRKARALAAAPPPTQAPAVPSV